MVICRFYGIGYHINCKLVLCLFNNLWMHWINNNHCRLFGNYMWCLLAYLLYFLCLLLAIHVAATLNTTQLVPQPSRVHKSQLITEFLSTINTLMSLPLPSQIHDSIVPILSRDIAATVMVAGHLFFPSPKML